MHERLPLLGRRQLLHDGHRRQRRLGLFERGDLVAERLERGRERAVMRGQLAPAARRCACRRAYRRSPGSRPARFSRFRTPASSVAERRKRPSDLLRLGPWNSSVIFSSVVPCASRAALAATNTAQCGLSRCGADAPAGFGIGGRFDDAGDRQARRRKNRPAASAKCDCSRRRRRPARCWASGTSAGDCCQTTLRSASRIATL